MRKIKYIYLDHAATTPLRAEVVETMSTINMQAYGNPSSVHLFGRAAIHEIAKARQVVSDSIHAMPSELIFNSGATEGNNTVLLGTALHPKQTKRHIISTAIEHSSVLGPLQHLEKLGFTVTYVPVDQNGVVSVLDIESAITEDTFLVSVMYVNNEVGSIQPIAEIGELLREREIYFHCDAVQAFGLLPIDVTLLGVDYLTVTAHKINGPKGVGALYVKQGALMPQLMYGGAQENNRRPGTESVANIVGFATAVSQLTTETRAEKVKLYQHYQQLIMALFSDADIPCERNGHIDHSLSHILNLHFSHINNQILATQLDLEGIAVSMGSACTSGTPQPSHVLEAMYPHSKRPRESIRISFGEGLSDDAIRSFCQTAIKIVEKCRSRLTNQ